MKKRYFVFGTDDGGEITAQVVGSKTAKAKIILYVSSQQDGETIWRVIKALDKKINSFSKRRKNIK